MSEGGIRVFFIRIVRLYHVISFLRMSTYRSISADYSQLASNTGVKLTN